MNDYFDQLELGLKDAVRRRAHVPWHARVRQLPLRYRWLAGVVAALVIATPTVGAVGAVSGWFGQGAPDVYHAASATSGLGKVLSKGGELLPIRASDPDGGPPWGIRLVHTTRGETCIQVGRVVRGQIGQLGIDGAWNNDHEFHEIKPNDQLADICGATDSAGDGFVNDNAHGAPASVDVPLYNSNGAGMSCRSPYQAPPGSQINQHGGKLPPNLKRFRRQWAGDDVCPAHAMRMIFAGLLGPDATSVTYRTPDGQTRTEKTVGGVGAYLIVFRETASNCSDYTHTALLGGDGCQSDGTGPEGNGANLQQPTAITRVTYSNGRTCSTKPDATLVAAWRKLGQGSRHRTGKQNQARFQAYLAAHHLTQGTFLDELTGGCKAVGWVNPGGEHLSAADVASPVEVRLSAGPDSVTQPVQITISFIARQPVTTANSYYEWLIKPPGRNLGAGGGQVQRNLRAGQRVTLTTFLGMKAAPGTYHGTVAFVQDSGKGGSEPLFPGARHSGAIVVGHFSFTLPLHH